jgi:hypothetical protein
MSSRARGRERGVCFVTISAHFDDDLIARLDLDEGWFRRMQALDIVHDRARGRQPLSGSGHKLEKRPKQE